MHQPAGDGMKITQIGHAAALVETRGISILSDPWWKGPCFGAQWWVHPKPYLVPVEERAVDYIYISHGHHDHLHGGTLKTLPRSAVILVSKELQLGTMLRDLGFSVIEISGDEEVSIGPRKDVRCRIIRTHGDDSLIAIDDGERVCININDALHSAPHAVQDAHAEKLKRYYPRIDYVLCGYGTASHFPNCYVIPGKDDEATARQRQRYFNREWVRVVHALNPRWAFPFAADVVLLEEPLFWTNVAVHNGERPTEALRLEHPGTTMQAIDIAPGFVIEDDVVVRNVVKEPVDEATLRQLHADGIRRANLVTATSAEAVDEIAAKLGERVTRLRDALASFPPDYRILIRFHNSARHVVLKKRGTDVHLTTTNSGDETGYDVVYRTRLAYLKWALHEHVGDEILFVGSGGVFAYASREMVASNVHRELIGLIRDQLSVRHRPGPAGRLVGAMKGVVNRLIGRAHVDLYDLNQWTVYRS